MYKYYLFTLTSVAIKPLLMWFFVNLDAGVQAEEFAVFILFQQIIVACAGTQIHKRLMLKGNMNVNLLVRFSFIEGVILALPAAVFMGVMFADATYFIAGLVVLPFEKVFDDVQRQKIYTGRLASHGMFSLYRAFLVGLAFFLGMLLEKQSLSVLLYGLFALLSVVSLNKHVLLDLKLSRYNIFFHRIGGGAVGILWSVSSVYLIQLDKFSIQLSGLKMADYMLLYQVLVISHMGFSLVVNNKYRYLSRNNPLEYFKRNLIGFICFSFSTLFIYIAICFWGKFIGVSVENVYESFVQVVVVINMMLIITLIEIVFWRYDIKQLLIIDGLILFLSIPLTLFVVDNRYELVLISASLMFFRSLLYLFLVGSVLRKKVMLNA